jgi:hypothetical protein
MNSGTCKSARSAWTPSRSYETKTGRQKPKGAKDIMPKACAEKQQLILAYQAQTQGYSAAVTALHNRTGRSSKTEYDAIYATAEDARMRATNAREALKTHTAEHGC